MSEHDHQLESSDEQLVHGLLRIATEDSSVKERRIERLMSAIAPAPRRASRPSRLRVALSIAASILFALVLIGVLSGGETARALVRSTIDAIETGTSRRYALEVLVRGNMEPALQGTVDFDGHGRVVMRLDAERIVGFDVAVGRDHIGEWVAHSNTPYFRYPSKEGWPRWMQLEHSAILLESIDTLLRRLHEGYELADVSEADDAKLRHIRARRNPDEQALPGTVDLWIEPETHTLMRMELTWPNDPAEVERRAREFVERHAGFLPDGPDFRHGDLLSPDRILYHLVAAEELPESWFTPESHSVPERR